MEDTRDASQTTCLENGRAPKVMKAVFSAESGCMQIWGMLKGEILQVESSILG